MATSTTNDLVCSSKHSKKPKEFPCGHSFCHDCLKDFAKKYKLKCPTCVKPWEQLPGGSVHYAKKEQPGSSNKKPLAPLPLKTINVVGERYGAEKGELFEPFAVAVSKTGEIYVADRDRGRILVFDMNMRYKRRQIVDWGGGRPTDTHHVIFLPATEEMFEAKQPPDVSFTRVQPWGLAFTKDDVLLVTDLNYNHSFGVDKDNRPIFDLGSNGCLQAPLASVEASNGYIYVIDWLEGQVKALDDRGKFQKGYFKEQPRPFNLPHGIAVNSRDQVIVSDSGNDRVQVFNRNGVFLFSCGSGGRGEGEGDLNHPVGVTVDQCDNIIVCDHGNHRIQMFDSRGHYVGRVDDPSDGVKGPWAIATVPSQPLKLIVSELLEDHKKLRILQVEESG